MRCSEPGVSVAAAIHTSRAPDREFGSLGAGIGDAIQRKEWEWVTSSNGTQ
jgi:hypothetical protein